MNIFVTVVPTCLPLTFLLRPISFSLQLPLHSVIPQFKKPQSRYQTYCSCRFYSRVPSWAWPCVLPFHSGLAVPTSERSPRHPTRLGPISEETSGSFGGGPPCLVPALPLPNSRTPRTKNTSVFASPAGRHSNWFCPLWLNHRGPEESEAGSMVSRCLRAQQGLVFTADNGHLSPPFTGVTPLAVLCHPLAPE